MRETMQKPHMFEMQHCALGTQPEKVIVKQR